MERKPNVLWIMTDEQRSDSLGCYGSPWARTPNLDALASRGALFTNAVAQAPLCIPARIAHLTASYPHQVDVWRNEDDPAKRRPLDHLVHRFRECGYATASFGKQHYCSPNRAFEREEDIVLSGHVGYTRYADRYAEENYGAVRYPGPTPWLMAGRFPADAQETPEAAVVREAAEWLDRLPADRPFFLRASFNGPHTPVVPPAPFDRVVDEEAVDLPAAAGDPCPPPWLRSLIETYSGSSSLTEKQIHAVRRCYYGYTAFIDGRVGLLLDKLREKGLPRGTIIVFLSDHGTHLGDYGLVQKQTFYEPVVRVPLIFSWVGGTDGRAGRASVPDLTEGPQIARGTRISTPVEARSLLPTLMDLAGVEGPRPPDAVSLADALRSGAEPPDRPAFSEFTLNPPHIRTGERLVMVRKGRWKLCLNVDSRRGSERLYDLERDPDETQNLYGTPEGRAAGSELEEAVFRHLEA